MPDIAIGYVHAGMVHDAFMRSMFAAIFKDQGKHLSTVISGSPASLAEARCDVVQKFLDDYDEEWLWFVDTDQIFQPDTHLKLLEAADAQERPIVSAIYYSQWTDDKELSPVWAVWRDDELKPVKSIPEGMELVRLAGIGMGCCLIHRGVLEKIRDRFGDDPWPWFGHDVIDSPKGPRRLGEDFTFCARAQLCGFPIYGVNHTVGHRKYVVFDDSTVQVRETV